MDKIKPTRDKSKAVHRYEIEKSFPDRFPYDADYIGIEIVGKAKRINQENIYLPVNDRQNESLKWLVKVSVKIKDLRTDPGRNWRGLAYIPSTDISPSGW